MTVLATAVAGYIEYAAGLLQAREEARAFSDPSSSETAQTANLLRGQAGADQAAQQPVAPDVLHTIQQHIVAEVRQTFAMAPDHELGRVACVLLTKDNGRYANALAGAVLRSKLTVKEAAAKSVRFAEDFMKDKAGATKSPCP